MEIQDPRLDMSPVSVRLFRQVLCAFPPLPAESSLLLRELALGHGLQLGLHQV